MTTIKSVKRRRKWIYLSTALLIGCLSQILLTNWTLHARLNLAVSGYFVCRLEPADQHSFEHIPAPRYFASFLVFNQGKYIGYLDRYGDFRSIANDDDDGAVQTFLQDSHIMLILVVLEGASGFVALFIAILGAAGFVADRLYGSEGKP